MSQRTEREGLNGSPAATAVGDQCLRRPKTKGVSKTQDLQLQPASQDALYSKCIAGWRELLSEHKKKIIFWFVGLRTTL